MGGASDLDLSGLVTIVGAGFSKHASPAMPLLSHLGDELAARLRQSDALELLTASERALVEKGRVPLGGVESWLTSLATAQPYNTVPERLRRRALFLDVSQIAREIITEFEGEALRAPMPRWLARLVTLWHYSRSTVLTFNYDTLIEATVSTLTLMDSELAAPRSLGRVTSRSLTRGFPPSLPTQGMRFAPADVESFELVKLHGSLNWWGRSSTDGLFSIVAGSDASRWGAEVTHTSPMRGLSPVVVPPIADKSGPYGNSTIETLWVTAANSIREASALVLFGYSLPPSDTTATALLTENTTAGTPIIIVDPGHDSIVDRVRGWLPENDTRGVGCADPGEHADAVDGWLDDLEDTAVSRPIPWFRGDTSEQLHPNCFVRIETADSIKLNCAGLDGDDLLLAGEQAPTGGFTVRPDGPPIDPANLAGCRFVRAGDGRQLPIYRFDRVQNTNEQSIVAVRTGPMLRPAGDDAG